MSFHLNIENFTYIFICNYRHTTIKIFYRKIKPSILIIANRFLIQSMILIKITNSIINKYRPYNKFKKTCHVFFNLKF